MPSYVIPLPEIRPTRYQDLGYRQDGPQLWRIYHTEEPVAAVGPFYASKAELMGDLDRYAREFGAPLRELPHPDPAIRRIRRVTNDKGA